MRSFTIPRRGGFTLIELMITIVVILIVATIALSVGNRVLRKSEADETVSAMKVAASALHEWQENLGRSITYGTTSPEWPYLLAGMDDPSVWRYDVEIPDDLTGTTSVSSLLSQRERNLRKAVEALGQDVWTRVQAHAPSRNIMAKIGPDLLLAEEENGQTVACLHDSWGTPIMVVFPGRSWRTDGNGAAYNDSESSANRAWRDPDATIRTFEEQLQGPARNGRVYLVSAGPDGRFGNVDFSVAAGEVFPPEGDPSFVQRPEYQQSLDNIYSYEVKTW